MMRYTEITVRESPLKNKQDLAGKQGGRKIMKATWKAWESKDGQVKRIYVSKIAYIEEGASGMPSQVGLTSDEIAVAVKVINGRNFSELFEMVKNSNKSEKVTKKSVAILKKEKNEKLANASSDEERQAIILEYAKLIKQAKYA